MWTSVSPGDREPVAIVPDGCVDVLWSSAGGLVIVGPMTRPRHTALPAGAHHTALRLYPGHAPRVLGIPASTLTDQVVAADEVLGQPGRRLSERL